MKSKKGIIITVIILAAIALASSTIWFIPQSTDLTLVITDFESQLDSVKIIHNTLNGDLQTNFEKVIQKEFSPDEYIGMAEISSSQINSQIIQLVESKAPEDWQESYLNYIESLKHTNSFIRESIVVANKIKNDVMVDEIQVDLKKMDDFKEGSLFFADASDKSRP